MKQYLIKPSFTFLVINICLYGLAAACLLLYFNLEWFTILLSLLMILWLYVDLKNFFWAYNTVPKTLTINSTEDYIDLNNSHQFKIFNVYTSRNSVIIKLNHKGHRQSLVLLEDRFQSRNDYLDCRYQLIRLNQEINAN